MSNKAKYMSKILACWIVTTCGVMALVYKSLALDVPIPTAQEVASWPASVVLGAVCIACVVMAYKTWSRGFELQTQGFELQRAMTSEIRAMRELLAARPCVMGKEITNQK